MTLLQDIDSKQITVSTVAGNDIGPNPVASEILGNPCTVNVIFQRAGANTILGVPIIGITAANPAVVTTAGGHGLSSGAVAILGTNCTPSADGLRAVTVLSSTTFSVTGLTTTIAGSTGITGPLSPFVNFTVKNQYGGTIIAQCSAFTLGAGNTYSGTLNLATTEANALFASQSKDVDLIGAVDWKQTLDSSATEGLPCIFRLKDRVETGTEPTPTGAAGVILVSPGVTLTANTSGEVVIADTSGSVKAPDSTIIYDGSAAALNAAKALDSTGASGADYKRLESTNSGATLWRYPQAFAPNVAGSVAAQDVTSTNGTWTDVTGLTLTLSLHNSGHKFRVTAVISAANGGSTAGAAFRVVRDGSIIQAPTAPSGGFAAHAGVESSGSGNSLCTAVIDFDDAPGNTSSHVYKVQACVITSGTGHCYINQTGNTGAAYNFGARSTLTLQEHQ